MKFEDITSRFRVGVAYAQKEAVRQFASVGLSALEEKAEALKLAWQKASPAIREGAAVDLVTLAIKLNLDDDERDKFVNKMCGMFNLSPEAEARVRQHADQKPEFKPFNFSHSTNRPGGGAGGFKAWDKADFANLGPKSDVNTWMKDPFAEKNDRVILGVGPTASQAEMKTAYRKLVSKLHENGDYENRDVIARVNTAADNLGLRSKGRKPSSPFRA